jgi:hypothetical protein
METSQGFQQASNPYGLSCLASDYLTLTSGLGSLAAYYGAIGRGLPWQQAFQQAFGITIETFYADFAAYRSRGFN